MELLKCTNSLASKYKLIKILILFIFGCFKLTGQNSFYQTNLSFPFGMYNDSTYYFMKAKYLSAIYNDYLIYGCETHQKAENDSLGLKHLDYYCFVFKLSKLDSGLMFNDKRKFLRKVSFKDFHEHEFVKTEYNINDSLKLKKTLRNKRTNLIENHFELRFPKDFEDSTSFITSYWKEDKLDLNQFNILFNLKEPSFQKYKFYGLEFYVKPPLIPGKKKSPNYKGYRKLNKISEKNFFKEIDKKFIDKCIRDFEKPN